MAGKTLRQVGRAVLLACPWLVLVLGLLAMAGWWLDIPRLQSVNPKWPSIKFLAAFQFALAGIAYWLIQHQRRFKFHIESVIAAIGFALFAIGTTLMIGYATGNQTWLEAICPHEADPRLAAYTEVAGRPSVVTVQAFGLVALVLIAHVSKWLRARFWLNCAVFVIGAFALVVGYGLQIEAGWYYWSRGGLSGMAIHTAVGFVLLGAAGMALPCEDV